MGGIYLNNFDFDNCSHELPKLSVPGIEDFNNFRLCGSAASHVSTKLPAAKYMARKFRLLKAIEPAFALWFWEWEK